MKLFLCEKPSQGRDIARVLGASHKAGGCYTGNDVAVTWCLGHLLEMAPPEGYGEQFRSWTWATLPILPYRWQLNLRPNGRPQIQVIRDLLAKASAVVIATDADREGEVIGREILEHCGWHGPIERLWLSALDQESIRRALAAMLPGDKTLPLYHAGLGRARADWLVGMNLTRLYTLVGRSSGHSQLLSVGRVQTPTLRIVVDRDRAIESFRAIPFWEVLALFQLVGKVEGLSPGSFIAHWLPDESLCDTEGRCINELAARQVAQRVADATSLARVTLAQTERVRESAPLPFDLGTLQQEASRQYGLSAKQVLDVAQSLYEAHKATSYPRTDCPYLPLSQLAEALRVLDALRRSDPSLQELVHSAELTRRSRAWNDTRITAHHAIIPTSTACDLVGMSGTERLVYDLIRRRYIAQFYPDHEYDQTRIELIAAGEPFRATGRREVAAGWRQVIPVSHAPGRTQGITVDPEDEEAIVSAARPMPVVEIGQDCESRRVEVNQCKTKPPARFTEGTLIGAMKGAARWVTDPALKQRLRDTAGLGTEATRAGIIETLLGRKYLERCGRSLVSTDLGRSLVDLVAEPVKDPGMTALWEQTLDDIAQGRVELTAFIHSQGEWVKSLVRGVRERRIVGGAGDGARRATTGASVGACGCGGSVMDLDQLWRCQTCNTAVWKETFGKQLTVAEALALLSGKSVPLTGMRGRLKKPFDGSLSIRNGRVKVDVQPGKVSVAAQGSVCPICGYGRLVLRTVKFGKNEGRIFQGCSRYPNCDYFAWTG